MSEKQKELPPSPGQWVLEELNRMRHQNSLLRSLLFDYRENHGRKIPNSMLTSGATLEQSTICTCWLCVRAANLFKEIP